MKKPATRLAILHLSDIHFSDKSNAVSDKYLEVGNALRSVDSEVCAVHVIVTGDIANKGQPEEYDQASKFFKSLEEHLITRNKFTSVTWSFAPGNHDCDFSTGSAVRDQLLALQSKNGTPSSDDEVLELLAKPQLNYVNFIAKFCSERDIASTICDIETAEICCISVSLISINTAISSKKDEIQGELYFPVSKIMRPTEDSDLAISFFHHPYGWLESNNARDFRKVVEGLSDIILTGHEHESASYLKTNLETGANNTFIEGSVFQDHGNPARSGFNVLIVDLEKQQWKFFPFSLQGRIYKPGEINPAWRDFRRNSFRIQNDFTVSDSFTERFLNDPGAGFTNSRKGKLTFSDIFVPGHLDEIARIEEKSQLVMAPVSMAGFGARIEDNNKILIIGEEQCGKTSFAKYLYQSFHDMGLVPLFIRASALKEKDIDDVRLRKILTDAFSDQYQADRIDNFFQLPASKRVLLIDDLHLSPFNKRGLSKFVELTTSICEKIVIFSHALSFIDEVETASSDNYLANFSQFEIKEFGNQLREDLIERWYFVGQEYTLDEAELDRMVVKTKTTLDQVLGKNLLPSYPIFILIILQQLEATSNINTSSGAHGYLYELLITSALNGSNARIDFDTSYTFLGMLAEAMFARRQRFISSHELVEVFNDFCKFSKQTIRLERVERPLLEARILIEHDGKYWFRYKYCYYYFAARYLSDRLRKTEGQERLKLLGSEIYREEYANILMFLAYLSNKDQSIIDMMLKNAREIYAGVPACDFDAHVAFVNRMHAKLPKAILFDQKSNQARAVINQRLDHLERADDSLQNDGDDINDALQLNVALKTIQVLGQMLKNFPSSLDGAVKMEIAEVCYQLGLRTMTRFIHFAEENQSGITALFEEWLGKMASKETEMSLKPKAEQFVAFLVEAFSTVVVRRVSSAVGVSTLAPMYEEIRRKYPGLAVNIIDFSLKLDHFEKFPAAELELILREAKTNIFPVIMLRRLTIEHFQKFPVERRIKQAACQKLQIELKHMQLLENKHKKM
ncbi:MAG: metallophosphoesterase [Massilia sp.]